MKKVMIDLDDVICSDGFLGLVNKFLNTNYIREEIQGYYIQDLIPNDKMNEWIKYFSDNNTYDYSELLPDAYEVIKKLNLKYDVYIASAYVYRDDNSISGKPLNDKFNYLYKNLPFLKPEKFIFINNKEILHCEIKIDDKLENLKGNAEMKLLFSTFYNNNITDEELKKENTIRVNNWKEIEKILL